MSTDIIKILKGLEKIENSLAGTYRHFSERKRFSPQVRKFWEAISEEELRHAEVFRKIREKIEADPEIDFSIDLEWDQLKKFADQARQVLAEARADDITESKAYSIGARIEADLDESRFLRLIFTGNEDIKKQIERIEAETGKHRMIMINYAKGVK